MFVGFAGLLLVKSDPGSEPYCSDSAQIKYTCHPKTEIHNLGMRILTGRAMLRMMPAKSTMTLRCR